MSRETHDPIPDLFHRESSPYPSGTGIGARLPLPDSLGRFPESGIRNRSARVRECMTFGGGRRER